MYDKTTVIKQITSAFAAVEYPGDWCLRGSNEGDEPYLLEEEFRGKTDWRLLDANFLDQAPNGLGSALSFFSDEAFHFFLPAYMVADVAGQLERSDPAFHLIHGLDNESRNELINPLRYGRRTWFEHARNKFAIFSREEAAAIVAYLIFKRESNDFLPDRIDQALANYWNERAIPLGSAVS
jgi:hypothetical protein